MKSQLFRASSILAAFLLLVAISLSGIAQEPTTRQQQPGEQQDLRIPELAVQESDSETLRIAVPQACKGIIPVVQTHDIADNFNPPGNAITLSPALMSFLNSRNVIPKGYDDKRINTVFADSFKLNSCRVCYATLEVRVRHQPGQWSANAANYSNDTILAGAAPFTSALRFIGPANIWGLTLPNPKTATFGITSSGLANLNSYLFNGPISPQLDVIKQDDTEIDYARLSVWYY